MMSNNLFKEFLFVIFSIKGCSSQTVADQQALHSALFSSYDSGEKPYCGGSVNLTLDLALRNLIDLNEPQQILKLKLWVRMKWKDCRLTWNPSSYGNIPNFVVPFKYIWTPDLTVFDSVSSDFTGMKDYRPDIYPDGTVYYNFPTILETLCTLNVEKFPYDTQACRMVFGSWVYHGNDMDIQYKNPYGDFSSAESNVEWNYISMDAARHVVYYGCCPDPYPDITYTLNLKRKPKFYVTSLLVPAMLITTMATLGFFLPVESGEKVSLQITVMLSLAVFQLLVADSLPPSADTTPVIATFFNFLLFLVGLACVMAVVVDAIYYQGNRPMPNTVYTIGILWLSRITFVHIEGKCKEKETKSENHKVYPEKKSDLKIMDLDHPSNEKKFLETFDNKSLENQKIKSSEEDWQKLSQVVDMLSLYSFVIIASIGIGVIFSQFS